jgi:hypothetical protein
VVLLATAGCGDDGPDERATTGKGVAPKAIGPGQTVRHFLNGYAKGSGASACRYVAAAASKRGQRSDARGCLPTTRSQDVAVLRGLQTIVVGKRTRETARVLTVARRQRQPVVFTLTTEGRRWRIEQVDVRSPLATGERPVLKPSAG